MEVPRKHDSQGVLMAEDSPMPLSKKLFVSRIKKSRSVPGRPKGGIGIRAQKGVADLFERNHIFDVHERGAYSSTLSRFNITISLPIWRHLNHSRKFASRMAAISCL